MPTFSVRTWMLGLSLVYAFTLPCRADFLYRTEATCVVENGDANPPSMATSSGGCTVQGSQPPESGPYGRPGYAIVQSVSIFTTLTDNNFFAGLGGYGWGSSGWDYNAPYVCGPEGFCGPASISMAADLTASFATEGALRTGIAIWDVYFWSMGTAVGTYIDGLGASTQGWPWPSPTSKPLTLGQPFVLSMGFSASSHSGPIDPIDSTVDFALTLSLFEADGITPVDIVSAPFPAAVPEPSSLFLLGAPVGVIAFMARRKRRLLFSWT